MGRLWPKFHQTFAVKAWAWICINCLARACTCTLGPGLRSKGQSPAPLGPGFHPGPTSTPRAPTNPGPGWAGVKPRPYRSACFARVGHRFAEDRHFVQVLREAVGLCPTSTFPSTQAQAQPALVPAPHCYPRF